MKIFVQTLYDYNFTGTRTVTEEDNSDGEDEMTISMVSDSQPHVDQQLVGYTDSESDEDEDEQPILDEESDEDEDEQPILDERTRMSNRFLMRGRG